MVSRLKNGRNFMGRSFGFTLLEMMIVIVIMGILLSIALPIYNSVDFAFARGRAEK
jgi:prepilin-type N-terminal cleavage/methylation domain-containing protein